MAAPLIAVINHHHPAFLRLADRQLTAGGYRTLICLSRDDPHEVILKEQSKTVIGAAHRLALTP